jgi:hypothetical protein
MFYIESHWIHQNTWKTTVCCLFSGCGINAFRMDSSNSSLAEKSCACAYIAFLGGIFSWYADSTPKFSERSLPFRVFIKNSVSTSQVIGWVLYASPHFTLLGFMIVIIFDEECKLLSSSLCSFLNPPVCLTLLGPNTLLSTLLSNTLNLYSSLNMRTQFHTHIKNR